MTRSFSCLRLAALSCLFSTMVAAVGAQTTITVSCDIDNTLYEDLTGSLSNGGGAGIFIGNNSAAQIRRTLLRFDVAAAVPAGAKVVEASLNLFVAQTTDFQALAANGHRVTQAWGEGATVAPGNGGGGGPAVAGDVTWLHTFYNTSFWTNAGGDFVAAPSFAMSLPLSGISVSAAPQPGLVADVQSWIDTPATNFGWVLKAQTETGMNTARRLNSTEAAGNKPTLSLTYLLPGQESTWGTGCPSPTGTYTSEFLGPMIGGTTISMFNTGGPVNGIGANYFALELNQPGVQFAPSCNIYLPLSGNWIFGFVTLYDNAGVGVQPWSLPTTYPGLYFMSQSFALENSAPGGIILANATVAVLQ